MHLILRKRRFFLLNYHRYIPVEVIKKTFLRWKTEREAEGIEFYDHLSKVMDTENDLSVGDMVAFTKIME